MKSFNIKNLGEYHHLYVQSDTTHLVDIFEKFKTLCLQEFELDPAYFCTTPGPAFEACLKNTKAKLELITDIDMELIIEKGIRGGISQPMQRYASANNKYMSNYNSKILSSFLLSLDANNLYGYAMSKKLPIDGFKWVNDLEKSSCDMISNTGYILEVDIEYPKNLHESHRVLPFLPIKKEKLLTTFETKENYVIHIHYGLVLKKVHRVISFSQEAWLKTCIDKNTKLRTEAKNDFE